jgi:Ni,Fe-hydrogenase maturation factor
MDLNDYKETLHLSSFHDTSFETALKLAKDIDEPIPESIYIIGIEIQEDTVFGDSLTEELQASYQNILKSVHDFILRIFNA